MDNVGSYTNLALIRGQIGKFASGVATFTGQGNGQGGREHGQKADLLPGYRKLTDPEAVQYISQVWGIDPAEMPGPGVSAYEMLDSIHQGTVRAMHVICSNPAVSSPNAHHVWKALEKLDFLVVNDFFLSETAEFADVVLPTTTWAEDEGTTTNTEGRVIKINQIRKPAGESKPDWRILSEIATRMGRGKYFKYGNAEEIFNELRVASRGGKADYYGITYEKIEKQQGVFWPCPDLEHPGTPYVYQDSFPTPDGKANLRIVDWQEAGEIQSKSSRKF